jgi:NADP-dependent 3-hydroxy acid dehydrogenase YdfG
LANRGWNVVATMRSPEKESILSKYENVLVTKLDVENRDFIEQAIARGIERFGSIDVIVNNAGCMNSFQESIKTIIVLGKKQRFA